MDDEQEFNLLMEILSKIEKDGKIELSKMEFNDITEDLDRMSEDSSEWREQVKTKVSTCMCSSILCEDEYLDGELHKEEIEKCISKLNNNKTGGVMV